MNETEEMVMLGNMERAITPYINTIVLGDCLDVMQNFPDKSVDLILADGPYGVRKKEEWDNAENFKKQIDAWLAECFRVSRTTIWFCAGKMLPYILMNKEGVFHRLLFWNKPKGTQFAGAMHSNIWYSTEPILVFGEYPKLDKSKKYGYSSFTYPSVPYKRFSHPTTKPLGLIKELVYFYSNTNDLVCDPFVGSGTTVKACKELGRRYIGIEEKEKHYKTALNRASCTEEPLF